MNTKHISYLDSVRGIACMIVVFMHFFTFFEKPHWAILQIPPLNFLLSGGFAVCIFFVLSGFVLSYKFIGNGNKWKIIEATIKRPVRLLGVVFFTSLPAFSFLLTNDFWTNRIFVDYDIYIKYFAGIPTHLFTFGSLANPPLWTINIEVWGSFLTFGIIFFAEYLNKYTRMAVLTVLLVCFLNTYYCAFIFGIIMADLHKNYCLKFNIITSFFILITGIYLVTYIPYSGLTIIKPGYIMAGAMLLFIFVLYNDKIHNILNSRLLVFIGGISYSLYAIHWLVLKFFSYSIYSRLINYCNNDIAFIGMIIISIPVMFIFSYLVDRFIDKPCIKFSGWFAKKLLIEIQNKIASSKISAFIGRYMKTVLASAKEKYHLLFTHEANAPDRDIKPAPVSPDAVGD